MKVLLINLMLNNDAFWFLVADIDMTLSRLLREGQFWLYHNYILQSHFTYIYF